MVGGSGNRLAEKPNRRSAQDPILSYVSGYVQAARAMLISLKRGMVFPKRRESVSSFRGAPVFRMDLIDQEVCAACQDCVAGCPTQCMELRLEGSETHVDIDWQCCMCCGICAQSCPCRAIELASYTVVQPPLLREHREQQNDH